MTKKIKATIYLTEEAEQAFAELYVKKGIWKIEKLINQALLVRLS